MSKSNIQQEYRSNINAATNNARENTRNSSIQSSSNYRRGKDVRKAGENARKERKAELRNGEKKKRPNRS